MYIKRILKTAILGLSAFYLLSMLWLFYKRLVYPYELDWIEGGMLTSVMQILDGHHLYAAPSISYVPFLYAPAFFYLSALVAKIMGASLLALRLTSIIASLVSLLTIVLIVFGETKSWFWGIASAGLFAGLYPASRLSFDLGRVDTVFLMFFLLFLLCLRRGNALRWQIAAGILMALTILSKQNGLVMCIPIVGVYFLFDWKHRLALPITFVLVYSGIGLALMLSSDGWYGYYAYSVVFSQPNTWLSYTFFDFIKAFILPSVAVAAFLSLFMLPFWFFRAAKERSLLWLVIAAVTIATSYAAKANVGGENNVVVPTFAILAILFGVCLAEILKMLQASSFRQRTLAGVFFCLLGLAQLTQVIYNPSLHLPSLSGYENGSKSLKFVKKFHGNVYLPNSSIALLAGKRTFAHQAAVWDVMHTTADLRGKSILERELQQALDTHLFDAIVIMPDYGYFADIEKYYVHDQTKYPPLDDTWKQKADIYVLP